MIRSLLLKPKNILIIAIIESFVLLLCIVENVELLFSVVMVLWTGVFLCSILNMKESPMLFCFMISFFVFLLGRQVCYHFLHLEQGYIFLNVTNEYTYICLILSLSGIITGILIDKHIRFFWPKKPGGGFPIINTNSDSYQLACKIVFFICFFATVIAAFMQIVFVRDVGYLASYTVGAGGAGVPGIVSFFSRVTPLAFCLYLGTKPSKRLAVVSLLLYEGYAFLSLMTGQRYPFIGISMLIFVYVVLRSKNERGWIKKHHFIILIMAVPILMLFLTAYDSIRSGKPFAFDSLLVTFREFFIQQGGSVNVIRRTIFNADQLKDMHFVSLQSIYSTLFENGFVRRLLNIKTYSGNSIEHALNTNNLAHRLSYIAYGTEYLKGRGTGSSYIAELLCDFGLVGVFIGNIVYGILINAIDRIQFKNALKDGIKLAMVYYLLLAPRGGFDSFVGSIVNLNTIFGFIIIIILTSFFENRESRQYATL